MDGLKARCQRAGRIERLCVHALPAPARRTAVVMNVMENRRECFHVVLHILAQCQRARNRCSLEAGLVRQYLSLESREPPPNRSVHHGVADLHDDAAEYRGIHVEVRDDGLSDHA